jgi:hypothetical protein
LMSSPSPFSFVIKVLLPQKSAQPLCDRSVNERPFRRSSEQCSQPGRKLNLISFPSLPPFYLLCFNGLEIFSLLFAPIRHASEPDL